MFIDYWLQYKKNTSSDQVVHKNCFLFLFWHSKQYLYIRCCELVFCGEFNEQSLVILWVNWIKNKSFWKRFACIPIPNVKDRKNDNWSLFYLLLIKHNLCIVIKNKGTMSEMSLTFTYLSGSKQSEVQTKGVNELNWRTMYSIFLGEKNNWEMGRVKRDFCLSTARCFCFFIKYSCQLDSGH